MNKEWGEDEDYDMTYLQDKELQVGLTEEEDAELNHLRELRTK